MANEVNITFVNLGDISNGASVPALETGSISAAQRLTATASNQQSSANTGKRFVRVFVAAACYLAFGTNPDATVTTASIVLPAGAVEYYEVGPLDKVAFVLL